MRPELLTQWWGPEGIVRVGGALDFTAPGPYDSTLINAAGARYRVSGHVTTVIPSSRIAFTRGWHDDQGARGHESFVTLDLEPLDTGGTRRLLTHSQLATTQSRSSHNEGWTSSVGRLVALVDQ